MRLMAEQQPLLGRRETVTARGETARTWDQDEDSEEDR
jgi:hypothetical protein